MSVPQAGRFVSGATFSLLRSVAATVAVSAPSRSIPTGHAVNDRQHPFEASRVWITIA